MRRTLFYLSVALLAFGVGSLVVIKFYRQADYVQPKIETADVSEIKEIGDFFPNKRIEQLKFTELKLKDLPCNDETLKIVWNNLTIETASINADRAERIKSCSDIIEIAADDETMDLNSDGKEEIIIRGYENPFKWGNNCYTYWIFEQIGDKKYKKLFQSQGYLPVVKNRKMKGYKDIMFEFYASYNSFTNGLYQFNGTEYVLKRCWFESNLYKNKDGDMVEGKNWKTKKFDCKEL